MRQTPPWGRIRDAVLRIVLVRDVNRIRRSKWFDPDHYLATNPDIPHGIDPALHYVTVGGRELLDPSSHLQARRLLTQVPGFRVGLDNPILFLEDHYIARGRPLPDLSTPSPLRIRSLLDNLQPADHPAEDIGLEPVDIIVPVHNSAQKLKPLLHALKAHSHERHTIILIDDASTEDDIPYLLAEFARDRANVEHLTNRKNLGYAASVNQGLRHSTRHKILLNSDTIVPEGWIDRLIDPILRNPEIASVTPYSNASTFTGFPENRIELALSDQSIVTRLNDTLTLFAALDRQLICGVGFCMAINSRAIDTIGTLDATAFEQGYFEDTEWCYRARRAGFRNVLANRLFVGHDHTSPSFGNSRKMAALAKSEARMREKFPEYFDDMDAFYLADPHQDLRRQCELIAACREAGNTVAIFETDRTDVFEQAAAGGTCVLRITPGPEAVRVAIKGRHFATDAIGSNLSDVLALMQRLDVTTIVADTTMSVQLQEFTEAHDCEICTPDTAATMPLLSTALKQASPPCIGVIAPAPGQAGWDKVAALVAHLQDTRTDCGMLIFGDMPDTRTSSPAVSKTGIYRLENIPALIRHHDIGAIYYPFLRSHIFACTHRELMAMELPIVTHGGRRAEDLAAICEKWTIAPDEPVARIFEILEAACQTRGIDPAVSSGV